MLYKDVKMVERSDKEPNFNPKNKTDRKIVTTVIIVCSVLVLMIIGLVIVYYAFFYGGPGYQGTSESASSIVSKLSNLIN